MFGFTKKELAVFKKLSTPSNIQDYVERIPINFEEDFETCMSPRRVLREKKAHCLEGALFAAAALWVRGKDPLIMNLKSARRDVDHVVALFRRGSYWGAISKTNHAVLRFREPVYKTPRELAVSYFHEYIFNDGAKTLRSFSKPLNLKKYDKKGWTTDEKDLWYISKALDELPHEQVVPQHYILKLRKADQIELEAGDLVEWKQKSGRKVR